MAHSLLLVLIFSVLISRSFAHEGHGIPGALPPAPHGGVVQEAKHDEDKHDHDHEKGHGESEKHQEEGHKHVEGEKHEEEGHKHAEGEAEEPELFFEAVYKDKELKIYPLVLPSGSNPMFQVLSPQKEFSSVAMKIEFPWGKTVQEVKPTIQADAIRVPFDAKKMNRFIIHITVKQNKEEKRASIQVENG